MTEYINKADAMKVACGFMRFTGIDEAPYEYADNLLNNLPTIEIVHCSECKWFSPCDNGSWQTEGRTDGYCKIFRMTSDGNEQINVESDWFCADGERRSNG